MLRKDKRLEYEFLPEAIELIETPAAPGSRILMWSIFSILVITIIWMYFGEVDMVATARGKVVPDGRIKVIQPFDEGIVQAIYVTEGQRVKEGEVLLELDATLNQIDVQNIQNEIDTLKLERDILQGDISDYSVKEELEKTIKEANQLSQEQYNLKKQAAEIEVSKSQSQLEIDKGLLDELNNNLKLLLQKENEYKKLIQDGGVEKITLDKIKANVAILTKEEIDYRELYEADAIARVEWQTKLDGLNLAKKEYAVQQAKANEESIDMQIQLNSISNEIVATKAQIDSQGLKIKQTELEVEMNKLAVDNVGNDKQVNDITAILEKDKKISELEAQLSKSEKSKEYKTILAPVSGTIQGLGKNTLGGVVSPAEMIMTIVPDDTPLVVEAYLPNKDIGFVEIGQEVSIKVDTFSYQKYGILKGKIKSISPDAVEDEKLGYVYRILVTIEKPELNIDGKMMGITSGMTVTAEVKTGKRKVISFFLEPLVKYFDESIKLR